MNISACLVTRGDVNMQPILDSLPFDDVIVWDNSKRRNERVFGRYAAIAEAKHPLIAVQDDDCLVPWEALLAEYQEGERLCNMDAAHPIQYSSLLGWGAIFPRNDPGKSFSRAPLMDGHTFRRTCDCIFTTLMPFRRVDLGHENLPHATAPNRMYHQPGHYAERALVTARVAAT